MGEQINELKSQLVNQLEKMQMNQRQQMEKITFCLLNSGDGNIEDLALHLFRSGKNSTEITRRGSAFNSRKNSYKKASALNSRKGSIRNDTSGIKTEIPNKTAILQAVGQDIIPEESEEEIKKKESKNISQRKSLFK